MSDKLPLSAIVIANKKGKNPVLYKVLDSLSQAEQIIVFDTGEQPIEDFAKVRNEALLKANQEYVLFVDSDEVLTKSSWVEIKKIVADGQADLVSILRSDIFLGKELLGGEAANQRLVRMGKKDKIKFIRPVHEVVVVDKDAQLLTSNIKLLHHSHPDIFSFFEKISFYSFIDALMRREKDNFYLISSMLFFPPLKFIFNWTVMGGYRDGMRGLVYVVLMSLHSFFVRVNGWELRHRQKMVR